jgi:hypothetical protein
MRAPSSTSMRVGEDVVAQVLKDDVEQPQQAECQDDDRKRRGVAARQDLVDGELEEERGHECAELDEERGRDDGAQRAPVAPHHRQEPAETRVPEARRKAASARDEYASARPAGAQGFHRQVLDRALRGIDDPAAPLFPTAAEDDEASRFELKDHR